MTAFQESIERFRQALDGSNLAARADAIVALCTPCVRVATFATPDIAIPVGASKIGGKPDVGPDFVWPTFQDRPLAFLGQFDLQEVRPCDPEGRLPASGLLSFFYEAEEGGWGFAPSDRGCSAVVWVPSGTALRRSSQPDQESFSSCRVDLKEDASLPGYDSSEIDELGLDEVESDSFFDFFRDVVPSPDHHLFGFPDAVQNDDMAEECAFASGGIDVGKGYPPEDVRTKAVKASARDWRLLLQLDSDDEAGMMWGDTGMLYFWIREADLRDSRFEEAWLILQCC